MKSISDLLQILLSLPGAIGFACCMAMAWAIIQGFALVKMCVVMLRRLWRILRPFLILPTMGRIFGVACLGGVLFLSRSVVSDGLQWAEYALYPVYEISDTSMHALSVYEEELRKHVDPYEFAIVQQRTREIAVKVGSTPLAIYEVAYSECGMNPFEVRRDGVAAGWIQFTSAGLNGLGASLDQIKNACYRRDTRFIMDLTELYLVDRSNGRQMPNAVDVYTCVFAPGYTGATDAQVLYSGYRNPAYYLNAGFDGYYQKNGRIFRSLSACDGAITIGELRLHLEAKKYRLLINHAKT